MSKGSSPRVASVPKEEFNNNWDAIFSKSKPAPEPQGTLAVAEENKLVKHPILSGYEIATREDYRLSAFIAKSKPGIEPTYVVKDQSKAEYRVYTSEGQELHAIVYPSAVFGENENIYSTVSVHGYQECVLHHPNVVDVFVEQVMRISVRNKVAANLVNVPEVGDLLLGWYTPTLFFNKLAKTKNLGVSHNPIGFYQELLLLANIGSLGECRIYSGAKAGLYTVFLLDELGTSEAFFNIAGHELAGIEKKMIAKIDLTTKWLREFGFLAEKTEAYRG